MNITYKSKKLQRICTIFDEAVRSCGQNMAETIHQRIDEMLCIPNVDFMIQHHIGFCHRLKHNRKGQYAVDLIHPYRLVFEVNGTEIQIAKIIEIIDYH